METLREFRSVGVNRTTAEAFTDICIKYGYKRWFILDQLIQEWIDRMEETGIVPGNAHIEGR